MQKYIEGSYPTLEDALMTVEKLQKEGYGKDEIYLVANEDVRRQLTLPADIQIEDDSLIDSATGTEGRSFWDRAREAFAVDNYDPDVYTREGNTRETNPLFDYRDEVRKGNIVVLVLTRDAGSGEGDKQNARDNLSSGTAAGKNPSDYVGVDSQTPRTINSAGGVPLGSNTDTVADPEKSLDVDVEGMEREHEQQRQWSEKSLQANPIDSDIPR